MTMKSLKEKGEADYDFKQDILFFKTKDRTYKKSIELHNIVLDKCVYGASEIFVVQPDAPHTVGDAIFNYDAVSGRAIRTFTVVGAAGALMFKRAVPYHIKALIAADTAY